MYIAANFYATEEKYIPSDDYMGTLIANPATEAAIDCNFDNAGYTICVKSEGSLNCFPPNDLCLSKNVYPALCFNKSKHFVVNQAINGSIVSVFCSKSICGNVFDGVAFNFKIGKLK